MELMVVIAITVCLALLLILRWIVRMVAGTGGRLPVTAEWIDELSIERYRPMMRLLDRQDLEFLRTQPGFTPRMASRLRHQRAQIFRGYLRCLNGDFARVCAAIKVLMLQSRYDRPDLASALVKAQVTFALGMVSVHVRLLLYRWGVSRVDVSGLVQIFEGMRIELRTLVPTTAAMTA